MSDDPQRAFYDRMRRAMGIKTLERLQESKVMVIGLSGLGVEIAKNLILSGLNSIYLLDDHSVEWTDLATNFYCTPHDIGSNRVESVISSLKKLNSFVTVERVKGPFNALLLEEYQIDCCIFAGINIMSLIKENQICRESKKMFIACEIKGLFGCIFNDLGDEFSVYDTNGEPPAENNIVNIEKGNPTRISVLQESGKISHGLGIDDAVVFSHVGGLDRLNKLENPVKVILGEGTGRYSFFADIDSSDWPEEYETQTGFVKQIKGNVKMSHLSLKDNILPENAEFIPKIEIFDLGKFTWGLDRIHPLFLTLEEYRKEKGELPQPYNEEDADKFIELLKMKYPDFPDENYARIFCQGARGQVNPIATIIGGMAAHEVLKAVSGRTTPLNQWFYMDGVECLPNYKITKEDAMPIKCRYDGQIMTFGKKFCEELMSKKIFMIGVGALGCEYLKNFAMMGICSNPNPIKMANPPQQQQQKKKKSNEGMITVTDMDGIEESNLNRQFLFREEHIGKMKSHSACEVVKNQMNPNINLKSLTEKVWRETVDKTFHDLFWQRQDLMVCALDNLNARKFVDGMCSYYQKPMIDAGTEGTKGNTFCVIPKVSETYSSQPDPPTQTHPHCTVANFPYKPIHCIVWSKQKFEEMFCRCPKEVNRFLTDEGYLDSPLIREMNMYSKIKVLTQIYTSLVKERPMGFDDCIRWARLNFQKFYHDDIIQLLFSLPLDHKDKETGLPFWSEDKRPPIPQIFDFENPVHRNYIESSANLRAFVFRLEGKSVEEFREGYIRVLSEINIPEFTPSENIVIEDGSGNQRDGGGDNIQGRKGGSMSIEQMQEEISNLKKLLPSPSDFAGFELQLINYNKDEDENYHNLFLTASSNNRCLNYRIPTLSFFETKGIAGQIIPALVTTTAAITGFGMLEILKALQGKDKIESFRNAYLNLAICLCTQSEPSEPKKNGYRGSTDWDFIEIKKRRDISLQEFLDIFEKKFRLQLTFFIVEGQIVYDNMNNISGDDLAKPLSKYVFQKMKKKPGKGQMFLRIEGDYVKCGSGDRVENFPPVKYQFRGFKKKRKKKKKMDTSTE